MSELIVKSRKHKVKKQSPDRSPNPYRLSRDIEPLVYSLEIKLDLAHFTFSGREWISFRARKPFASLVLHALDLKITKARLLGGDHSVNHGFEVKKISFNQKYQTVTLGFGRTFKPGEVDKIYLEFEGTLNDRMHGFYRTSYQVNGEKRWGAATQLEATDARRVFPCWDEPDLKAEFEVTLTVPRHLSALSNMPIQEEDLIEGSDLKKIVYQRTPRMPTYLVAFVVADLEYLEGKDKKGVLIRVWTAPGKKEQGRFALEVASHALSYFADWFGIPYALPKLDMVSLPDFAAGAMENWGLVTYRETALLVDPKNSSAAARQRVAEVIDHELAHQWFGNLVTMKWWTDLWLNEGFASYMGPKAVDHQFPEWRVWDQYVANEFLTALRYDSLKNTHPIEIPVKNPHEIREIFDHITYSKGSVVNRMLEHYLGEEKFRKGLHRYLKFHAIGNARTQDLWAALEKVSGKPVKSIMTRYTKQEGYPVLLVREKTRDARVTLVFEQKRFVFDGSKDDKHLRWSVPIGIKILGVEKSRETLLEKRCQMVSLPRPAAKGIKINPGESGFYRVAYSPELLAKLKAAIRSNRLSVIDCLGILDGLLALARAGYLRPSQALEIASYCRFQTDYNVWLTIANLVRQIENVFAQDSLEPYLATFARVLFRPVAKKMGWNQKPSDQHQDFLLRSLAIGNLGYYGDSATVKEARKRFKKGNLDPNLRSAVYAICAQHGGPSEWKNLLAIYGASDLQEEKVRVLRALTHFRRKDMIRKVLEFSLSSEVRTQDAYILLAGLGSNPIARLMTWRFVKSEWKTLVNRYSGGAAALLGRIIEGVTSGFHSPDALAGSKRFFKTHSVPGTERTIEQSLEMIRSNIDWRGRDYHEVKVWLEKNA